MNSNLLIPYALDRSGNRIQPFNAIKGHVYRCPYCDLRVSFKSGSVRTSHFSHRPSDNCESIQHRRAKAAICDSFREGRPIYFAIPYSCSCPEQIFFYCRLPTYLSAVSEYAHGGYIYDVALLLDGRPVLAIEVCQTNPCSEDKWANSPIPILEFDAKSVLDNVNCLSPPLRSTLPLTAFSGTRVIWGCSRCESHWPTITYPYSRLHDEHVQRYVSLNLFSYTPNSLFARYGYEYNHLLRLAMVDLGFSDYFHVSSDGSFSSSRALREKEVLRQTPDDDFPFFVRDELDSLRKIQLLQSRRHGRVLVRL